MTKVKSLKKSSKGPYKTNPKTLSLTDNKMDRPDFSKIKKDASRLEAKLATNKDYSKVNLTSKDLAAPHRAPYSKIRDRVFNGNNNKGSQMQLRDMVKSLTDGSKHYEKGFRNIKTDTSYHELADLYEKTRDKVDMAFEKYNKDPKNQNKKKTLTRALNNLASNAPGLGPHLTANQPVSDRLHLNVSGDPDGTLTPRSKAASLTFADLEVAAAKLKLLVTPSGALQKGKSGSHGLKEINGLGDRVFRGSLYVNEKSKVYKPRNPFKNPTGVFKKDWQLVK
jgi:hypothetical protein